MPNDYAVFSATYFGDSLCWVKTQMVVAFQGLKNEELDGGKIKSEKGGQNERETEREGAGRRKKEIEAIKK